MIAVAGVGRRRSSSVDHTKWLFLRPKTGGEAQDGDGIQ
jgi:hypothetical protein